MFENVQKSKYSMGFDLRLKEPETLQMAEIIEDAYISGYSKNSINKYLTSELGFTYDNANAFTAKVWKMMINKGVDRKDGMGNKNLARLEHIYKRALDVGDFKNALSAIDQMNKLCQLYKEKVEITTDEYVLDLIGDGDKKDK